MVHLGQREPELYGNMTANELDALLQEHANSKGYKLDIFYTNIEGEAINRIYQAAAESTDGLVMNPAGFNYSGFALRDCVKGVELPYIEVHMTNVEARGIRCAVAPAARGVICGFGS